LEAQAVSTFQPHPKPVPNPFFIPFGMGQHFKKAVNILQNEVFLILSSAIIYMILSSSSSPPSSSKSNINMILINGTFP
jgi:hypothetical protein